MHSLHNDIENIFTIVSECEEKARCKVRTYESLKLEDIGRRGSSAEKETVTEKIDNTAASSELESKPVGVSGEDNKLGLRRQCSIGEDVVKTLDEMEEEKQSVTATDESMSVDTRQEAEDVPKEDRNEGEDILDEAPKEEECEVQSGNQVATSAEILVIITNLVTSCMRLVVLNRVSNQTKCDTFYGEFIISCLKYSEFARSPLLRFFAHSGPPFIIWSVLIGWRCP